MKTSRRIIFFAILIVSVGFSVYLSFNAISRQTYEYEEQENIAGTGLSGTVLVGFSGNSSTKDVRIYHPMVKNVNRSSSSEVDAYIEDTSRNVTAIDKFTFVSDENMEYCYIGPDVAYIDDQAFFGCFSLHAVIVDKDNPYYTDVDGVLYTKDLSEIIIYPTYHILYLQETGKVEQGYYDNGAHLEEYEIPEGVKKVATGCFYKIWGIRKILIPSTLEEIGDMSFFKCESLELITLPDGLKTIGNDAFSYCKAMKYAMYIPRSVTSIGNYAFYKCDGLEVFCMGAENEDALSLGGRWQPKDENMFKANDPIYAKTRADADSYNALKDA